MTFSRTRAGFCQAAVVEGTFSAEALRRLAPLVRASELPLQSGNEGDGGWRFGLSR